MTNNVRLLMRKIAGNQKKIIHNLKAVYRVACIFIIGINCLWQSLSNSIHIYISRLSSVRLRTTLNYIRVPSNEKLTDHFAEIHLSNQVL